MNKAVMYHSSNYVQRRESEQALQEFIGKIKWRLDGRDSVLDAGCGSGDITHDLVLPLLPPNFKRLIGVDISRKMLNYARRTHIHPKLSFHEFDLNTDLKQQTLSDIEPFDHIFSFYCLMWIPNQKLCIQNFYHLLNSGGDMLLVFLSNHPVYDVYKQQSQNNKWADYMVDVDQQITPYQYSENPADEFRNLLFDCEFSECDVKVHDKEFVFDSFEVMQDAMHSVNPFIDRIPADVKQMFLDDLINQFVEKCDVERFNEEIRIRMPYKLIVAYARKRIQ